MKRGQRRAFRRDIKERKRHKESRSMGTNVSVMISKNLSAEFCSNVLITAFDGQYGGSWYWADCVPPWLVTAEDDDSSWLSCTIKEDEHMDSAPERPGEQWVVDHAMIAQGIGRILNGTVKVSEDIVASILRGVLDDDAGEIDADGADCIVQAAVFDELVYG